MGAGEVIVGKIGTRSRYHLQARALRDHIISGWYGQILIRPSVEGARRAPSIQLLAAVEDAPRFTAIARQQEDSFPGGLRIRKELWENLQTHYGLPVDMLPQGAAT